MDTPYGKDGQDDSRPRWPSTPTRHHGDGEVVVRQGQDGHELYLLERGRLDVYATEAGRRVKINDIEPGEIFGEVSFFDRGPASAEVVARGDVRLRVLTRELFDLWVDQRPELVDRLRTDVERDMAARVRRLTDMVAPLQVGAWQSTLLGGAAHDLRNPLAVITGTLQTLAAHDAELTAEQRISLLNRAGTKAFHLTELLQGMIELSRLELTGATVEPEVMTFSEVAETVAGQLACEDHAINVDGGSLRIRTPRLHLTRILANLVGNACQHGPVGSTVTVTAVARGGDLEVRVDDEGPGVPDEAKAEVFRPFVTDRRNQGGTGLGLALVAMLAQLNDGRAWVEDRPGGGASFRVLLPRAVDAAVPAADRVQAAD